MPQPTNPTSPAAGKADPIAEVRARLRAVEQRLGAAKDAWPADLNAGAAGDAAWGADPPEVARG